MGHRVKVDGWIPRDMDRDQINDNYHNFVPMRFLMNMEINMHYVYIILMGLVFSQCNFFPAPSWLDLGMSCESGFIFEIFATRLADEHVFGKDIE